MSVLPFLSILEILFNSCSSIPFLSPGVKLFARAVVSADLVGFPADREKRGTMQLTVFFDGQFWVGVIEQHDDAGLKVARYLFGPEPTDTEVFAFV
jgi:hypothetical protein